MGPTQRNDNAQEEEPARSPFGAESAVPETAQSNCPGQRCTQNLSLATLVRSGDPMTRAPFSYLVRHGTAGYAAGIIGQDRMTGALRSEDVAEQCSAMMDNLATLLQELGPTFFGRRCT